MAVFTFGTTATLKLFAGLMPKKLSYVIPTQDGLTLIQGYRDITFLEGTGVKWDFRGGQVRGMDGGTLTEFTRVQKDKTVMSVTGMKVDFEKVALAIGNSNTSKIADLMLKGNDTMFFTKGHDNFRGGAGNDRMFGLAGNDTLRGDAGKDVLDGGTGNDALYGSSGADTFVFKSNYGVDRIKDFDSTDKIDLRGLDSVSSYGDLMANHARQSGSSVVIDGGHGDKLVIEHTKLPDLHASDFLL